MAKNDDIEQAVLSSDYIRKELKKIALQVVKDMSKATENAVSAFYSDYRPHAYVRRYGMKNPFKVTTDDSEDGVIKVLFTYSSDFISGHNNPDIIFQGPFEQGYHGGPHRSGDIVEGSFSNIANRKQYGPAPKMSPSPWEMIEEYYDNYTI